MFPDNLLTFDCYSSRSRMGAAQRGHWRVSSPLMVCCCNQGDLSPTFLTCNMHVAWRWDMYSRHYRYCSSLAMVFSFLALISIIQGTPSYRARGRLFEAFRLCASNVLRSTSVSVKMDCLP